jgi:Tfp pilus assembly protein PilX
MQKKTIASNPPHRSRGSALLIVLAFLLLLTTLTVAFLSRATMERQMSNSSYSQNKTDLVAQGSIATIIADLQQEIVAGSNAGSPVLTGGYYYPSSPLTVTPALAVPGYTSTTIVGTGMENLVKVSKNGQAFWPTANYSGTITIPNRASAINTSSNPSLNYRSVSAERWNAPLLLARQSPTNPLTTTTAPDYTPVNAFSQSLIPDWIYVARDGTNPQGTTMSSSWAYLPNIPPTTTPSAAAGTNPVTQRYAYAIYNEGGTLDMNVAGSPMPAVGQTTYTSNQPYKNALSYADITQLPYLSTLGTAGQRLLNNAIVGWRNNFSAYVKNGKFPGTSTAYSFQTATSPSVLTPFDQNVVFNPGGFLSMGGLFGPTVLQFGSNPNMNVRNSTDNAFSSRQELIQFFTQGLGQNSNFTASVPVPTLINVLQYMGTFSRDINQPSYAPNPSRPVIVGAGSATAYQVGGNDGCGNETSSNPINPSFLSLTIPAGASWTRNDNSTAVPGEPLVKKRFALSRLAWITYEGPSALRTPISSGVAPAKTGSDGDLWRLEFLDGIPQTWLAQGTATNIQNYFGLVWNAGTGTWTYEPKGYTTPYTGAILTLSAVAGLTGASGTPTAPREANFFELLKAGILAGALGKDYYNPNDVGVSGTAITDINNTFDYASNTYFPLSSVDRSIFQIGANIIDQSTTDGYPTVINFSLAAGAPITEQVAGVKNLPYVYGVRTAIFTTALPTIPPDASPNSSSILSTPYATSFTTSTTIPTSNQGTWIALQEPEIWNPHGWDPNDINSSVGYPAPSAFSVTASTPASINVGTGTTQPILQNWSNGFEYPSTGYPPYPMNGTLTFSIAGSGGTSNAVSTTGAAEFREPTLLLVPNVPSGSNLAGTSSGSIGTATQISAYGVPSNWTTNPAGITGTGASTNNYVGFEVGSGNLLYLTGTASGQNTYNVTTQIWGESFPQPLIQYAISCTGPYGPLTYDTKIGFVPYSAACGGSCLDFTDTSTTAADYMDNMIPYENVFRVTDPRTARLGFTYNEPGQFVNNNIAIQLPPRYNGRARWVNSAQDIIDSMRPDNHAGYGMANYATYLIPQKGQQGWTWGNNLTSNTIAFRQGLLAQNTLAVNDDGIAFNGTPSADGSTTPTYYADADGVVRRAMAGYLTGTGTTASGITAIGQPMAIATTSGTTPVYPGGTNTGTVCNRPVILNRPFRSVGELGYVFSDSLWKNLDLQSPESGYSGLMDVFCVNDTNDPGNLVAGRIDLNTRQAAVIQAVLSGACVDKDATLVNGAVPAGSPNVVNGTAATPTPTQTQATPTALNSSLCASIASKLVSRTTSTATGQGPLRNPSELVGTSLFSTTNPAPSPGTTGIDGTSATYFSGFSNDLTTVYSTDYYLNNIERFHEAPIRALAAVGTTRVWNLMIDVIAQTGRFPSSASSLANFNVEGERRYWVHVAIDRYTGKVLDEQIEEVKE